MKHATLAKVIQHQIDVGLLVRRVATLGVILCIFVVVLYGVTQGNWLQGILAGITLAKAMLPDEFPMVLTVFLALGAWRLSKIKVLARHVPVIETLGSATVLCVDKTGTFTVDRMSIHKLAVNEKVFEVDKSTAKGLPDKVHEIVEFGILASQRDPFDPMEKIFHDLGNSRLAKTEPLHADWSLERGYPLSPSLLVGLQRQHVIALLEGIRTFPLMTVFGTVCALLAGTFGGWVVAIGVAGVAATALSGRMTQPDRGDDHTGLTTAVAMPLMYAVGAYLLVQWGV